MIPTFTEEYGAEGEKLLIGWASWDKGQFKKRSIKRAYPDKSGKISRGCPELSFNVLVDMVLLAKRQGELSAAHVEKIREAFAAD